MPLNSVTEDVVTLLENLSLGTKGTDLFGFEWGTPISADGVEIDSQILVIENEAFDSPLKELYEQPVFQILVRGNKKQSGKEVYAIARNIFESLITQDTQAINGTDYLEFEPLSNISLIGRDEENRYICSMNFYTFRNPI